MATSTSLHPWVWVLVALAAIAIVLAVVGIGVFLLVRRTSPVATQPIVTASSQRAHNGGVILALGIASLVLGCFPVGIIAWVMGASDLRGMERGEIDPTGRGMTQAGMVLGIVSAAITVLFCLAAIVVFVLAANLHGAVH